MVIVDRNNSKSTKCIEGLEQKIKAFGAQVKVTEGRLRTQLALCWLPVYHIPLLCTCAETPSSPSRGNMLIVGLDTALPLHWDTIAKNCLAQPGVAAGAFRFGSDIIHDSKKR